MPIYFETFQVGEYTVGFRGNIRNIYVTDSSNNISLRFICYDGIITGYEGNIHIPGYYAILNNLKRNGYTMSFLSQRKI